ncbi:hypothetical protein G5C60_11055 [Streptomyces sp. HC44]|uniref:Uncharacterized protein n=1 Tax=Streptomyces scabichelini TaxID=2711217 RepID=A0A6G4V2H0_9ACTN|nr:hypothetical protein [Streptomyces scabichelini]NGO08161.1 hypothetical protein [Streptomyces scabichelini]
MAMDRRTAVKVMGLGSLGFGSPGFRSGPEARRAAITVQAESAVRTNMPTARDRRASGGALLALATARRPPERGWYATYEVDVPAEGPYRLAAVATVPVEQPHIEEVGSYFKLAVGDAPPLPVARSQPYWYESAPAWGDLSELTLGVVELARGRNTITFVVDEPTVLSDATGYRFLLDRFTLTPVHRVAPLGIHLGDPAHNLGTYRGDEPGLPQLTFALEGRTERPRTLAFTVTDYFGNEVARGRATVPAGRTQVSITLPELRQLPPGHYRVTAAGITGCFARLPGRRPVTGPGNRFGVNSYVFSLVPPSRLDAFAAAMKDMGAGHVRDGMAWPAAEPRPGTYDTRLYDTVRRAFHRHGLATLDVLTTAPEWAMTEASLPLTADLRDTYRYAAHLAAASPDAVQLSNEPDVDTTSSTGDQHAAFVKAAALGIADAGPSTTVTVLPGIADAGSYFQILMLQNDVARYADAWGFHGYPDPSDQADPDVPESTDVQRELRRLYGAARLPMWMTESGIFLNARPGSDLTPAQQAVQARYLVRATVGSLAAGTGKQFWFGAPPIHDEGVYFGLLSRDFQPWPAYSAHAALTSLLGEARFVERLSDACHVFADGAGRHVTVAWATAAEEVSEVEIPVVSGVTAEVYDIMGRRVGTVGPEGRVKVSQNPVYVVQEGIEAIEDIEGIQEAESEEDPDSRPATRNLSAAEHIVLSQRFDLANAAPNKADGDAEPPLGYRLSTTTRMAVDVYNFNAAPQTVDVTGQAFGGWTVRPTRPARPKGRITVPPKGRTSVEFTVVAGEGVRRGVDYPLVFEASIRTADGERSVPPSVSRIQRRSRRRGRPIPLAPSVDRLTPADGTTVDGPDVRVEARITDALSGVDAARVDVEVDGRRAPCHYDPATGRLTAALRLRPGRHEIWVRAYNRAHAPARASVLVTVRE